MGWEWTGWDRTGSQLLLPPPPLSLTKAGCHPHEGSLWKEHWEAMEWMLGQWDGQVGGQGEA